MLGLAMRKLRSAPLMWKLRSILRTSIFLAVLGMVVFTIWTQGRILQPTKMTTLETRPAVRTASIQEYDTQVLKQDDTYNHVRIDTLQHIESKISTQTIPRTSPQHPTISEQPPTIPDVQVMKDLPQHVGTKKPKPPVTSVLHPNTPDLPPLNPKVTFDIKSTNALFEEYQELFPQHGKSESGMHYRIQNTRLLSQPGIRESHSVLIICVFNGAESWGKKRTIIDFFNLIMSFNYPKEKISITLLTSSIQEFSKVKTLFATYIHQYPRLSLIFRNDFAQEGLTRLNRHNHALQAGRRRMLARYRNFALLSTMESWHQHVLWLDADIIAIPADLLPKIVRSGRDIQEPMCVRKRNGKLQNYDKNAWVGQRKVRSSSDVNFVPGPLNARSFHNLSDKSKPLVELDSVGGTMLYVRADIHRQGVMFPTNYVIGSEWGREGYDGIETEGLCYTAHFLGYKCWGVPNDVIQHV